MLTLVLAATGLCTGCGSSADVQPTDTEPTDVQPADVQEEADAAASDAEQDAVDQQVDYEATVYTDADEGVKLSAIADGRPLVLNFWATWCPYCVQEIPDFQEVSTSYGDKVAFVFLDSVDGYEETQENTRAWLEEYGLEGLPVYYDNDVIARNFDIYAFPTTVIFSADGELAASYVGALDSATLRAELDKLV